jgi:hypothetical protein
MTMASVGAKLLVLLDVALFVCGLVAITWLPLEPKGDAAARYRTLNEYLETGHANNSAYSMLGPLLATPLWKLGETPEQKHDLVAYFNVIVFVVAAIYLFVALRPRLGGESTRRFMLLLLFATAFPHELQNFNNEVLSALALGGGLLALFSLRRVSRVAGTVWIAIASANMPGIVVGASLGTVSIIQWTKKLRFVAVPALCAAFIMAEAWWRRGSPTTSGYEDNAGFKTVMPYSGLPGFSYPFALGAISILFSFGKGLLFFYPGMFLPIRRWLRSEEMRQLHRCWICVVLGLILVYSRWWSWYGGSCWGPRFFLFAALPASLTLAMWTRSARSIPSALGACAITAWCLWVGYAGLVFENSDLDLCWAKHYRLESFCWYMPEFSPLVRPFITARELQEWEYNTLYLFCAVYLRITLPRWRQLITETTRVLVATFVQVGVWRHEPNS